MALISDLTQLDDGRLGKDDLEALAGAEAALAAARCARFRRGAWTSVLSEPLELTSTRPAERDPGRLDPPVADA